MLYMYRVVIRKWLKAKMTVSNSNAFWAASKLKKALFVTCDKTKIDSLKIQNEPSQKLLTDHSACIKNVQTEKKRK